MIASAQALCNSSEVQISWHQAAGVENYLVTAAGSLGYVSIHNTTQSLLSADFPCGQDYNVTVRGRGSDCDSIPSSPAFFRTGTATYLTELSTFALFFYSMSIFGPNVNFHPLSSAPCIPSDVTTYVQCELSTGSVSWGASDGADTYTAVATGLDGHTHACHTNTTSCSWDNLHCGEEYTVVLRANGDNCTSLPSNSSVIYMSMYDMLNKMSLTYLIKLLGTKKY